MSEANNTPATQGFDSPQAIETARPSSRELADLLQRLDHARATLRLPEYGHLALEAVVITELADGISQEIQARGHGELLAPPEQPPAYGGRALFPFAENPNRY